MPLTIRQFLQNPAFNRSRPHILGDGTRLDDDVRGIHIAESADLAGLIEGGELILCSGLGLSQSVEQAAAFLDELHRSGASGVVFSFLADEAPVKAALRTAATSMSFPVVLLDDRARFIEIIEAYNEISRSAMVVSGPDAVADFLSSPVAEQLSALDLLRTAADLLDRPLILEDELSVVLFQRGLGMEQMSLYAQSRQRAWGLEQGRFELAGEQWVHNPVFVDGRRVGRIVCPLWRESAGFAVILDRLSRILGQKLSGDLDRLHLLRQEFLADAIADLRTNQTVTEQGAWLRLRLFGVTDVLELIPAVLCIASGADEENDLSSLIRRLRIAFEDFPVPVIVRNGLGDESEAVGMMFCLASHEHPEVLLQRAYRLVESEIGHRQWSMGIAGSYESLKRAATDGLLEAYRVARGALSMVVRKPKYYLAHDLGFRWILQTLVSTPEGAAFVRDQLGPLKEEPELLAILEAYLGATGNIAELSRSVHLSRPSVYARLRRLHEEFGIDVENADTRTSLHMALALYRLEGL
ncbi:hypothetical protein CQ010_14880 [Arthrobacter sp. MYb211]|uniref:PucR family transcriptional regulator n=1 Tax=unclassified Arthrobacter TaxID=235627 RepID=UPI000CFCC43D|nr:MULTISPECIES: PucR family transcriptional regulator [unclassified Arthrobacter]PRA10276.1 hypothetical protein CQ015_14875 [Arthrobacter sp. MYb221]PRC05656.1 hypothetical protein CQ010_14880 [Arthrobacter sp. MYb211]